MAANAGQAAVPLVGGLLLGAGLGYRPLFPCGVRKPERLAPGLARKGREHDEPCYWALCYPPKGQGSV